MAFLIDKSQLRTIDWGKTYLWEVVFPDAPQPFNKWFPASDIEEPQWNLETETKSIGFTSVELPIGTSSKDVKITFYDSQKFAIHDWLRKWVESEILNNGQYIGYLSTIGKQLFVRKYLEDGTLIKVSSYIVYPKGSQFWNGTSDSQALTGMAEFVIISGFWDIPVTGDSTSNYDPLSNNGDDTTALA